VAIKQESANETPSTLTSIPRPIRWRLYFRQNWLLLLLIGLVLVLLALTIMNVLSSGTIRKATVTTNAIVLAATAVSTNTPNPTPIEIVVQASPTLIPVTPTFTNTPPPTETPVPPTETAVPPTAVPITNPILSPITTSAPSCVGKADSSWGNGASQYETDLGCATTGIITYQISEAAYQMFPEGMMIWRANTNQIHVLHNDATLITFNAGPADPSQANCQNNLQNSFGWLWCTKSAVQSLGIPAETERNATNMVVQQFDNGLLLTYSETNNNLVLLTGQNRWETFPK